MSLGNVLVIRPGALGDAVLTLPVLHALHNAGATRVTVLGSPASWRFLDARECPILVSDFASSGWLGLFSDGATLSKEARDILNDTHTAIVYLCGETMEIQRRLTMQGVARIVIAEPPVASSAYVAPATRRCFDLEYEALSAHHAARQSLDPLAHCVEEPSTLNLALNPLLLHREWLGMTADSLVETREQFDLKLPCFALHPGSGGRKKCWPAKRFAELSVRIFDAHKMSPIVFFGPADEDTSKEFAAAMPSRVPWRSIENESLTTVSALLKWCEFYVGNDSGMTHLAARAVPVLSIFGPTDPDVWGAIGKSVRIVQAPGGDLSALDVETVFNCLPTLTSTPRNVPPPC